MRLTLKLLFVAFSKGQQQHRAHFELQAAMSLPQRCFIVQQTKLCEALQLFVLLLPIKCEAFQLFLLLLPITLHFCDKNEISFGLEDCFMLNFAKKGK